MGKLAKQLPLQQMQTKWAAQIDPFLSNPQLNRSVLKSVSLATGNNVINHLLGRKLQGWNTSRIRAVATIHDAQDSNQTPELTLILVSSAPVVVDLEIW